MRFNSQAMQFSISSSRLQDSGVYTISIMGSLGKWGATTSNFTLTVINPCLNMIITPSKVFPSFTYYIGDTALLI